jgi:GTP-binding protein
LVFTKADKQSSIKTDQNIAKFKKAVLATFEEAPGYFVTSAETMLGRDEVLGFISKVNQEFTIPSFSSPLERG